jgi:hypothetical protein
VNIHYCFLPTRSATALRGVLSKMSVQEQQNIICCKLSSSMPRDPALSVGCDHPQLSSKQTVSPGQRRAGTLRTLRPLMAESSQSLRTPTPACTCTGGLSWLHQQGGMAPCSSAVGLSSEIAAKEHTAAPMHLVAQGAGGARLQPPLDAVQVEHVPAVAPRDAEAWVVIVACAAR